MKALCWFGKQDVRVETVPDPKILNPHDALIEVTTTAICGSDLHLYDGYIPMMHQGDILGHEFMGRVVEVGRDVQRLKKGDRVVVPFTIACGQCFFCKKQLWSCCDNTNPDAATAETVYGFSSSGLFGYSHMFGGYAGGQAEYVARPLRRRRPDARSRKGWRTNRFFSCPTSSRPATWRRRTATSSRGDTVAVWGCGPVGQFAIRSAYLLGAERVIAVDHVPRRLEMARTKGKAEVIDFDKEDVVKRLTELTGGRGPDACIEAVGLEAEGHGLGAVYDQVKASVGLATDRLDALRQAIMACRKGGVVSVPGVYGGLLDKFPFGAAFSKGLTFKMGQTHVHRYMRPLLERIQKGDIDPTYIISHRLSLDEAPTAYKNFRYDRDHWTKVVLKP